MNQPDPQNNVACVLTPPRRSLLARIAYWLACIGPLSFLIAMTFHPRHPGIMPGFSDQPLWWLLRLTSPFGIVLGTIALIEMRCRRYLIGFNHAAAAIVVGLLTSFFTTVGTIGISHLTGRRHGQGRSSCYSNLKQLTIAIQEYMVDYDDHVPLTANWNDALYPYTKNDAFLRCPSEPEDGVPSYALNRNLQHLLGASIREPASTVLLFDSRPGKNLAGDVELLPYPVRHITGDNIGFLDGHVRFKREQEIYNLIWKPAVKTAPDRTQRPPARTKNSSSDSSKAGDKGG